MQISEAFEVLSDSNKRAVYDQFGEEGLKNKGPTPGQGGPGSFSGFGGFPGGGSNTFTFTTGPGGFGSSGGSGFAPTDPNKIFEQIFGGGFGGFGGLSGMSGGARNRSMFEDDDMDGSFSGFGGNMPGGMPRRTSPSRHQTKQHPPSPSSGPSEITKPLKVSLQELYNGTVKHLRVGRRLLNGTTEDKVLEIQIQPGWKSGTKIRFPRAGNEQAPHGDAQDLVFVVEEKPHVIFRRDGNDLSCRVPISLVDALTGSLSGKLMKTIEMLDGRKLQVNVPSGVVKPGQEMMISGEGMPIRKDGSVKKKGDLFVKWEVTFPDRLTPAQQEDIRKILGP
ncbi:hypothetical protein BDZ94DRAFT_1274867 [Collybia nuda]|uniref:Chaperone DnaJ C-terminal domain-containing protein n=1 Tax=Collybia nuda TaxID=64659 RepID=A0A9P5XS75_9AGAR|nr:hypothetical protein BDZ94DRAFT_1274867 [Collybia nuda]